MATQMGRRVCMVREGKLDGTVTNGDERCGFFVLREGCLS
jgi:hypothetical protein